MAAYTVWFPEVLPNVLECPEVLVVNALRNTCIEFCNATNWWQGDYGTETLAAADLPFSFTPAAGVSVQQIMVATIEGRPLALTNIDELDAKVVNWRAAEGQPRAIFQPTAGIIDLYPRPEGTDTYDVFMRVAYTPTRTSTAVDDTVYENYLEEIAAGALARLMKIPGKPWSNPEAASMYDSSFQSAKVQGNIEASRSYGRGGKQIQFRNT